MPELLRLRGDQCPSQMTGRDVTDQAVAARWHGRLRRPVPGADRHLLNLRRLSHFPSRLPASGIPATGPPAVTATSSPRRSPARGPQVSVVDGSPNAADIEPVMSAATGAPTLAASRAPRASSSEAAAPRTQCRIVIASAISIRASAVVARARVITQNARLPGGGTSASARDARTTRPRRATGQ